MENIFMQILDLCQELDKEHLIQLVGCIETIIEESEED